MRGLLLLIAAVACVRRAPTTYEMARRAGERVPPAPTEWVPAGSPLAPELVLRSAPGGVGSAPEAPPLPTSNGPTRVQVFVPGRPLPDGSVLWGWVWVTATRPAPAVPADIQPAVTPMSRSKGKKQ